MKNVKGWELVWLWEGMRRGRRSVLFADKIVGNRIYWFQKWNHLSSVLLWWDWHIAWHNQEGLEYLCEIVSKLGNWISHFLHIFVVRNTWFLVGQASFEPTCTCSVSALYVVKLKPVFPTPKSQAVQCQLVNLLNWTAYRDHCQDKTTMGFPYNESDDAKGTAPSEQVLVATDLFLHYCQWIYAKKSHCRNCVFALTKLALDST